MDVAEVHALHDRRVPATSGNINHLVIGRAGVFVIDAKLYDGQTDSRDVGGLFRTDKHLPPVISWGPAGRLLRAARLLGPLADYPRQARRAPRGRCLAVRIEKASTLVTIGIR